MPSREYDLTIKNTDWTEMTDIVLKLEAALARAEAREAELLPIYEMAKTILLTWEAYTIYSDLSYPYKDEAFYRLRELIDAFEDADEAAAPARTSTSGSQGE